jgi:hypothetical protein
MYRQNAEGRYKRCDGPNNPAVVSFTCIKIAAYRVCPGAQAVVNRVAASEGFDLLNQERAKNGEKAHASIINCI